MKIEQRDCFVLWDEQKADAEKMAQVADKVRESLDLQPCVPSLDKLQADVKSNCSKTEPNKKNSEDDLINEEILKTLKESLALWRSNSRVVSLYQDGEWLSQLDDNKSQPTAIVYINNNRPGAFFCKHGTLASASQNDFYEISLERAQESLNPKNTAAKEWFPFSDAEYCTADSWSTEKPVGYDFVCIYNRYSDGNYYITEYGKGPSLNDIFRDSKKFAKIAAEIIYQRANTNVPGMMTQPAPNVDQTVEWLSEDSNGIHNLKKVETDLVSKGIKAHLCKVTIEHLAEVGYDMKIWKHTWMTECSHGTAETAKEAMELARKAYERECKG